MKKKTSPIFACLWLIIIVLFVIMLVKHFHIKNFNVIERGILYTSGQPRGMDYTRLLYKYHIATFVNLRVPNEHREENWNVEEVEWMKSNGVKYVVLPIGKHITIDEIPDVEACQKFIDLLNDKTNRPVLLHDSSGKQRVAYLAAVWMLKSGRYDLNQTIKKVQQITKKPLNEKEITFLKSLTN